MRSVAVLEVQKRKNRTSGIGEEARHHSKGGIRQLSMLQVVDNNRQTEGLAYAKVHQGYVIGPHFESNPDILPNDVFHLATQQTHEHRTNQYADKSEHPNKVRPSQGVGGDEDQSTAEPANCKYHEPDGAIEANWKTHEREQNQT